MNIFKARAGDCSHPAPPPPLEFFKYQFSAEKHVILRQTTLFSGKQWRKYSGNCMTSAPLNETGPVRLWAQSWFSFARALPVSSFCDFLCPRDQCYYADLLLADLFWFIFAMEWSTNLFQMYSSVHLSYPHVVISIARKRGQGSWENLDLVEGCTEPPRSSRIKLCFYIRHLVFPIQK